MLLKFYKSVLLTKGMYNEIKKRRQEIMYLI